MCRPTQQRCSAAGSGSGGWPATVLRTAAAALATASGAAV